MFNKPQILLSPDAQKQMSARFATFGPQGQLIFQQIMQAVKTGLAQGIHNVFVMSLGIMILGLIIVFFLKEVPLRGTRTSADEVSEADAESTDNLAAMI